MLSPTEHEHEARALGDEIRADTGMALYVAIAVARSQVNDLDRFALAWDAMVEHQRREFESLPDPYLRALDKTIPRHQLTLYERYLRDEEYA